MSHAVNFDDVQGSIRILLQQGLPITLANVRSQLGHRGSMTTISKYVSQWRQEQYLQDVPSPQSAVPAPDPIFSAVQNVWQQLVGVHQEQLVELKEQHSNQIQELDSKINEKENQIKELSDIRSIIEAELKLKKKEEERLTAELIQEKQLHQIANQRIVDLQAYQEQAKSLLSSFQENISKQLLDTQAQYRIQLEALNKAADLRCGALQLQMEEERHQFLITIDQLKTEHAALIKRLEREDTVKHLTQAWLSFASDQQQIFSAQVAQSEIVNADLQNLIKEWPKLSTMIISNGLAAPYGVDFLIKTHIKKSDS